MSNSLKVSVGDVPLVKDIVTEAKKVAVADMPVAAKDIFSASKAGIASVDSLASRKGYFEGLAGIANGTPAASAELGWKIRDNISVFTRGQWKPDDYAVYGGVKITW